MKKTFEKSLEIGLLTILILLLIAFLGDLQSKNNIEKWSARPEGNFLYIQNPSCTEIKKQDTPLGVVKEYQFSLKEAVNSEKRNGYLCFQAHHQYVDVYIGKGLLYSHESLHRDSKGYSR